MLLAIKSHTVLHIFGRQKIGKIETIFFLLNFPIYKSQFQIWKHEGVIRKKLIPQGSICNGPKPHGCFWHFDHNSFLIYLITLWYSEIQLPWMLTPLNYLSQCSLFLQPKYWQKLWEPKPKSSKYSFNAHFLPITHALLFHFIW